MARDPRYLKRHSLVEVTTRCYQNRYLLRPSPELNDAFAGVLAKGQEMTGMPLVGAVALSSHYHLLAIPEDQEQLSRFMCFVNCNLSKEIGRLHNWPGASWETRYHAIPVDTDESAQVERLRYLLAQSVKEHLVERPEQWPGVHCAQALREGRPIVGKWCDRTKLFRRREVEKKEVSEEDFIEETLLRFSPLPCWSSFSPERYREEVGRLIETIVDEAAQKRLKAGFSVLGATAVLEQDPHYRPGSRDRSPPPRFHTSTVEASKRLYIAFSAIFADYRIASEKLRAGDVNAEFPEGTFPCSLPFVPFLARGDPA